MGLKGKTNVAVKVLIPDDFLRIVTYPWKILVKMHFLHHANGLNFLFLVTALFIKQSSGTCC